MVFDEFKFLITFLFNFRTNWSKQYSSLINTLKMIRVRCNALNRILILKHMSYHDIQTELHYIILPEIFDSKLTLNKAMTQRILM